MGDSCLDKIIGIYNAKLEKQVTLCEKLLYIHLYRGEAEEEELPRLSTEISKLADTLKTVLILAEEKEISNRKHMRGLKCD
jgi:hypothetical protein